MLREQLQIWENYPPGISMIVVDDGSPQPALDVIQTYASPSLCDRLTLYRITIDIPWNSGARNLGARQAATDWIMQIDLDHVLPSPAAPALLNFEADPKHWYRFERYRNGAADETRQKDKLPREATYGKIHPHMDSYLCTRELYWKARGYDERYSGCLGGGTPFLKELAKVGGEAKMAPSAVCLEVYTRNVIADASVRTLSRDRTE
jgi:glycosyltransferase involved in cell wall biosynthesis